jgi:glycerol-3-phosphate cytidylyltransferase-like family protein
MATGYFDILRAAHIHELAEIRRRAGAASLLVVVLPRQHELLPQRARAELVAALRLVDYVLLASPQEVEGLRACLQPVALVRLEEAEAVRLRELIARVKQASDAGSREPK